MDLGIDGKKALVCASSRGLGRACAFSLAREGVEVTITGRSPGHPRGDGGRNSGCDRVACHGGNR